MIVPRPLISKGLARTGETDPTTRWSLGVSDRGFTPAAVALAHVSPWGAVTPAALNTAGSEPHHVSSDGK